MKNKKAVEKTKNTLKKIVKVSFKVVMFTLVTTVSILILNACVASQNLPEPFDGKEVENTNPIIDPLVKTGEGLGHWINDKVDPGYDKDAN